MNNEHRLWFARRVLRMPEYYSEEAVKNARATLAAAKEHTPTTPEGEAR